MKTSSKFHTMIIVFVIASSGYSQKASVENWKYDFIKGKEAIATEHFENALKYLDQAYLKAKINLSDDDSNLKEIEYLLGIGNYGIGDYKKSEAHFKRFIQSVSKSDSSFQLYLANALNHLGNLNTYRKNIQEAEPQYKQALSIIESSDNKDHAIHHQILMDYSNLYFSKSEFSKALGLLNQITNSNVIYPAIRFNALCQFAYVYHRMGLYQQALRYCRDAIAYGKVSIDPLLYIRFVLSAGHMMTTMGDYDEALPLLKNGLEQYRKIAEKNNDELWFYSISRRYLADLYAVLGQTEKALSIYNEILTDLERSVGKEHRSYSVAMTSLGLLYYDLGRYSEAESKLLAASVYFEHKFTKTSVDYGKLAFHIARLYSDMDRFDEAINYATQSLDSAEKLFGKENYEYGQRLRTIAAILEKQKKFQEALSYSLKALDIIKQNKVESDFLFPSYLINVGNLYSQLNIPEKAVPYLEEANQLLNSQIDIIFNISTEIEKKSFLKTISRSYDRLQAFGHENGDAFPKIQELNYNNRLRLKGILLKSTKDVFKKLAALNDPLLDEQVGAYRSARENLIKQYGLPREKQIRNVDSLKNLINHKEAELIQHYRTIFTNEKPLVQDWNVIRTNLKKGEIAIEFSSFISGSETTSLSKLYCAYLITKESISPQYVFLFEESQLQTLLKQKVRGSIAEISGLTPANASKIYDLIWEPLEKHFGNAKTIYYSPDGLLHQLTFAAIGKKDELLCSKYNLIQVSNTRNLSQVPTEPSLNNTLLIAGITYDYNHNAQQNTSPPTATSDIGIEYRRNGRATRGPGEAFEFLSGTLTELNTTQKIFKDKNLYFTTLQGADATESAFKALSEKSPPVIHIATHGFFYENLNQNRRNSETNQYVFAEDPLVRSGLVMAGANEAWLNGTNPYEQDDGILTSMEISNLDLSKTDMVVLSACDTGLGDIDGSEGVYGLQRAFKMAGVKIIVMSLWEVPDAETAEYMELFYGNWLKGMKVRDAFNKAQKAMMKKYKDEPLKWAGFVMFE